MESRIRNGSGFFALMSLRKIGTCAICGSVGKLSFEHVPPKSAFNNKSLFLQSAENFIDPNHPHFARKKRSHQGLGDYTLCETCNKSTGSYYGKSFADFAYQGMRILTGYDNPAPYIIGNYTIKPLNVIKQIISMFFSSDKLGILRSDQALVNFVLDKENKLLPTKYSVYLYSTYSRIHRFHGYHVTSTGSGEIHQWCEINFKPFGFLLAIDSGPAHSEMVSINSFSKFSYNEEKTLSIVSYYLSVKTGIPGIYG